MEDADHNADATPPGTAARKADDRALTEKWGKETLEVGFTVVPAALLRGQKRLGIGRTELAVLIHLLDHWWDAAKMPWPKQETIAERLDCGKKTVQRALVALEKAELIRRNDRYLPGNGGRTSNEYDLAPLVERLRQIAIDMKAADKEAKAIRRKAQSPGLRRRRNAPKQQEAASC